MRNYNSISNTITVSTKVINTKNVNHSNFVYTTSNITRALLH